MAAKTMIKEIRNKIYNSIGKRFKDYVFKFRSVRYSSRYLSRMGCKSVTRKNVFYFVFDKDYTRHPGLADRLKAVLGCYYIAKNNNYDFRIIDQTNSCLDKFMVRNSNFIATTDELEYSWKDTKLFHYSTLLCGVDCKLTPNRQYHCYCYLGDDLFYQNGREYISRFRDLFNDLFAPTAAMKELLGKTGLEKGKYISVHARFVNLLETFENSKYPTLPSDKKEELIQRCLGALRRICEENTLPVVMFSDSKLFLDRAKSLPVIVLDSDGISHISFVNNDAALAKTYLDFLLIMQSSRLYRFMSSELHPTGFSIYASFAGGIECIDTNV